MPPSHRITIAHVTHEAVEKIGGIGTVLEGLITSAAYQRLAPRTILIGPMSGGLAERPAAHLGGAASLLYSAADRVTTGAIGRKLRPIEWAFGVRFAYGVRRFREDVDGRTGEAELLLVDITNPSRERLNAFKFRLWERFGIDAARHEGDWSFEEFVRLAEPAFYALSALLQDHELPCVLFSHEFMGIPTALKAVMDGGDAFRTIFHAHECGTARKIVEEHPGHDTTFYNAMRIAQEDGAATVETVFGSQSNVMRHDLVARTFHLSGIAAVGDYTADELRFLSDVMRSTPIDIVYNGVPSAPVTFEQKLESRRRLDDWAERIAGFRPDLLITHVARPVISKAFWRDLKVAERLDSLLGERDQRALIIILTCGAPIRSFEHVDRMYRDYGWPWRHREGFPDLSGPEIGMWLPIEAFNRRHSNVRIMLVNQFGFSQAAIGSSLPPDVGFGDLRRATDAEFGMSIYEPFGIAQLEPLSAGGICVVTNVCGCVGLFRRAAGAAGVSADNHPNLVIADFTELDRAWSVAELLNMSQTDRDRIEDRVAQDVASGLVQRLPRNNDDRARLLASGRAVAERMGWDAIVDEMLAPLIRRIV